MIKLLRWIYTGYSISVFITLMLFFALPILIPLLLSERGDRLAFIFLRIWARWWSALSGIRYEVHGLKHIHPSTPYIYIFNHRSFVDAPVIPLTIPQEVRSIGKKELARIPVFGTVVGRLAVWVDRSDAESRRISAEKLVSFLRKGKSIVVAPEGTRNDSPEPLLPFQKGAFRLSVETGIPILPMAVIGADRIMGKGSLLLAPGTVRVYFSSPIMPPAPSETAVGDLIEKSRNRLEAMIVAHE